MSSISLASYDASTITFDFAFHHVAKVRIASPTQHKHRDGTTDFYTVNVFITDANGNDIGFTLFGVKDKPIEIEQDSYTVHQPTHSSDEHGTFVLSSGMAGR